MNETKIIYIYQSSERCFLKNWLNVATTPTLLIQWLLAGSSVTFFFVMLYIFKANVFVPHHWKYLIGLR